MRGRPALAIGMFVALAIGTGARAAPLNLSLELPDIASGFLSVDYDAEDDLLTVSGYALTLDFDGAAPPDHDILSGSFEISLPVDSTGTITPGEGTLTIEGEVLSAGPSLLTGEIAAFGYLDGGGEIFEFVFDGTGGDLAGDFVPGIGVILDAWDTGFTGSFDGSFSNSGFGVSDTGVVPEPGTLGLLTLGGLSLTVFRRRYNT